MQRFYKPLNPIGDFDVAALSFLKNDIIFLAGGKNAGRQTIEPKLRIICSRKHPFRDCSRDAPVPVVKRMKRDKAQSPQKRCRAARSSPISGRRNLVFRVVRLPAPRSERFRDCVGKTPFACVRLYHFEMCRHRFCECRCIRSEQGGEPRKQPFPRQRRSVIACGVEHHFRHAVNVAARCILSLKFDIQAVGDGGAHLLSIQDFAFDFRRFYNFAGKCIERRFVF